MLQTSSKTDEICILYHPYSRTFLCFEDVLESKKRSLFFSNDIEKLFRFEKELENKRDIWEEREKSIWDIKNDASLYAREMIEESSFVKCKLNIQKTFSLTMIEVIKEKEGDICHGVC
jgi:hypothetical protein